MWRFSAGLPKKQDKKTIQVQKSKSSFVFKKPLGYNLTRRPAGFDVGFFSAESLFVKPGVASACGEQARTFTEKPKAGTVTPTLLSRVSRYVFDGLVGAPNLNLA